MVVMVAPGECHHRHDTVVDPQAGTAAAEEVTADRPHPTMAAAVTVAVTTTAAAEGTTLHRRADTADHRKEGATAGHQGAATTHTLGGMARTRGPALS